jgi:Mrp family chromosome partitioning ATPase
MSKNFELLQRASTENLFTISGVPGLLPAKTSAALLYKKVPRNIEIAKLVQRLFSHSMKDRGPKIVSFSGITRDDRSSWICARAGEALAEQAGATVCIVEANFFAPQLHVHFDATNRIGLAEALAAKGPIRNFAVPLDGENLWLITSGLWKPAVCPSMQRYRERFAELREAFDYILVSASPVSRETEATMIGQLVDGVVLVVEANHTRRETARRAKEQLESGQVRLLGAVLDQRTFPIPEKLYRRL